MVLVVKQTACNSISLHLVSGNLIVQASSRPQEGIPLMKNGNVPLDGDALKINEADLPKFKGCPWLKRLVGGEELLNGRKRWVLWLKDVPMEEISEHPEVMKRVELCAALRKKMKKGHECPDPRVFMSTLNPSSFLAVPLIFSEMRPYVIADFFDGCFIPTNQVQIVSNAETYHFGVLSSAMHMTWILAVAGRLDLRMRYSESMCWNTFPWPCSPNSFLKQEIGKAAEEVVLARKEQSKASLAELYDCKPMPSRLKQAHQQLDALVDRIYGAESNPSADRRLNILTEMYCGAKRMPQIEDWM